VTWVAPLLTFYLQIVTFDALPANGHVAGNDRRDLRALGTDADERVRALLDACLGARVEGARAR